jgi:hypothetical protein
MTGLESAITGLQHAVGGSRRQHAWGWLVCHRLAAVKEALLTEGSGNGDAWLAAREQILHRERDTLVHRIADLGPKVLESPDLDGVCAELHRLVGALERYRQRLNDLVYDSVSLEIGGSE